MKDLMKDLSEQIESVCRLMDAGNRSLAREKIYMQGVFSALKSIRTGNATECRRTLEKTVDAVKIEMEKAVEK